MKAIAEDANPAPALPCCGSGRAQLAATSEGMKSQGLLLQTKACDCFAGMAIGSQGVVLYSEGQVGGDQAVLCTQPSMPESVRAVGWRPVCIKAV